MGCELSARGRLIRGDAVIWDTGKSQGVARYCQTPQGCRSPETTGWRWRERWSLEHRARQFGLRAEERQLKNSPELSTPPPALQYKGTGRWLLPQLPPPGTLRSDQTSQQRCRLRSWHSNLPCRLERFLPRLWGMQCSGWTTTACWRQPHQHSRSCVSLTHFMVAGQGRGRDQLKQGSENQSGQRRAQYPQAQGQRSFPPYGTHETQGTPPCKPHSLIF